jgi:hypothetical protein
MDNDPSLNFDYIELHIPNVDFAGNMVLAVNVELVENIVENIEQVDNIEQVYIDTSKHMSGFDVVIINLDIHFVDVDKGYYYD